MKYIATAVTALVFSIPAQATLQTYEFTASVSQLGHLEAFEYAQRVGGIRAGTFISLGDKIVGRFSYDTSIAPASSSADPGSHAVTQYAYPDTASATNFLNFTILPSGQTIGTGGTETKRTMGVGDRPTGQPGARDVLWIANGGGFNTGNFGISMNSLSADWVQNGQLPEHLSFADLVSGAVYHNFVRDDGHTIYLNASLTSLTDVTVNAVPEPATWAMMLAGVSILGVSARRKRR